MATTGPGRPENKNAPATDSEGAELEKTLEDATAGVVETAKSNSNLIIIVVLGIVALLALPSVLDRVDEQKDQITIQLRACEDGPCSIAVYEGRTASGQQGLFSKITDALDF